MTEILRTNGKEKHLEIGQEKEHVACGRTRIRVTESSSSEPVTQTPGTRRCSVAERIGNTSARGRRPSGEEGGTDTHGQRETTRVCPPKTGRARSSDRNRTTGGGRGTPRKKEQDCGRVRWNVTRRIRRWKQRRLLIADAMIFESDKDARTPHRRGVHPRRSGREEAVRSRRCVLPYPEKPRKITRKPL